MYARFSWFSIHIETIIYHVLRVLYAYHMRIIRVSYTYFVNLLLSSTVTLAAILLI